MSTYDAYNLSLRDSTEFTVPTGGSGSEEQPILYDPNDIKRLLFDYFNSSAEDYSGFFAYDIEHGIFAEAQEVTEETNNKFTVEFDPSQYDYLVPDSLTFVYNIWHNENMDIFFTVLENYVYYFTVSQEIDAETGDVSYKATEIKAYNYITKTILPDETGQS